MSLKNALLRPVEIITGKTLVFSYTDTIPGYTVYYTATVTPTPGVWANMLSLIERINNSLSSSMVSLHLSSDFKIVVTTTANTVSVTDNSTARRLGFSGGEIDGVTVTADYRPQECWIPTFYTKDTDRFQPDTSRLFFGSVGSDGRGSGIPMTSPPYRVLEYTNEKAPNVMKEASNITFDSGGTTYYPESERCFETVINASRGAYNTATTSSNLYSSGLYFIDQLNQYLGSSPLTTWPTSWGDGGIYFDITDASKRDDYIFTFVTDPAARPQASDVRTASYYDLSLRLNTATASSWKTGCSTEIEFITDPPS